MGDGCKNTQFTRSAFPPQQMQIIMLIPADSKRSSAFGRKCRAEKVQVLEVIGAKEGISTYDNVVKYHVGDVVKTQDLFCDDWMQECASGIHFFITRIEAENYNG
jgi:hypothetical protein